MGGLRDLRWVPGEESIGTTVCGHKRAEERKCSRPRLELASRARWGPSRHGSTATAADSRRGDDCAVHAVAAPGKLNAAGEERRRAVCGKTACTVRCGSGRKPDQSATAVRPRRLPPTLPLPLSVVSMVMASADDPPRLARPRPRVPAARRREELIGAAVREFALTGLHGTSVGRIARRVDVAQPYVFALFPTKLDLFLATIDRCFDRTVETFCNASSEFSKARGMEKREEVLQTMGAAYKRLLVSDHDFLMLQQQAFAACHEEPVRARVRRRYAELFRTVQELSGASPNLLDEFFHRGMGYCMTESIAVAMGVGALSVSADWVD